MLHGLKVSSSIAQLNFYRRSDIMMSMSQMPEEKLILLLPKRSIALLHTIVTQQVEDAETDLRSGIEAENQSLISSSEAALRCLDPIIKELDAIKKRL